MGAVARTRFTYYLLHKPQPIAVTFERGSKTMSDYKSFKLNDGGSVPTIAFGTGTSFFNRNDDVADAVVKGIKAGYKLIDTAIMYGTEKGVGVGIKKALDEGLIKREDLTVTTKLPPYDQSIDKTIAMVDESLKLLQLDYVDNVLIHFPGLPKNFDPMKTDKADPAFFAPISSDPERAPEARMIMWEALQKCVQDGKVKHIGVSNFCRMHIEKMVQDPRCKVKPALNQIEFNPYVCDDDILKVCGEHGIVVQAYSPIGSGTKVGRRGETLSVLDDPVLKEIAAKIGCGVGQLCIAWALKKRIAVSTKTEKEKRMAENLQSSDFVRIITEEDSKRIGELNANLRKYFEPYSIP